jgi:hypothetical protein
MGMLLHSLSRVSDGDRPSGAKAGDGAKTVTAGVGDKVATASFTVAGGKHEHRDRHHDGR